MKMHEKSKPAVAKALALTLVAAMLLGPGPAAAQQRPADLTLLPPTPTTYTPADRVGRLRLPHTWPIENLADARILFQRPKESATACG